MRTRLVVLVFAVAVVLSPYVIRAIDTVSSPSRLIVHAGLPDGSFSWNPLSPDANFVTGPVAAWILINLEYPTIDDDTYGPFGTPFIHSVVGNLSLWPENEEVASRNLRILKARLDKGTALDARLDGLTVLHHSILSGSVEALGLVLAAGADPCATVNRPGKLSDGLNALEFAELLESRVPGEYRNAVQALVRSGGTGVDCR